jgi:hypothetical protein
MQSEKKKNKKDQPNNKISLPWILSIQLNLYLQRACLFIHVFLNNYLLF